MCLYPRDVILAEYEDNKTGEIWKKIIFSNNINSVLNTISKKIIQIPCGKCFECCNEYSMEWSYRIMNESTLFKDNCFITLTYKDNPFQLQKRDLTLFLKRLRKKISPLKVRYFACGEYGERKGRPHFHLILFGWKPNDLTFLKKENDNFIYTSRIIEKLWNKGFVSVGDLTLKSAKYCAKYMQKAIFKTDNKKVKPFVSMSLKPGIGAKWFENNFKSLETDKIYIDGSYHKLPRYYLKIAEKNCFDLSKLRKNREKKCLLFCRSEQQLQLKREYIYKKFNISIDKKSIKKYTFIDKRKK